MSGPDGPSAARTTTLVCVFDAGARSPARGAVPSGPVAGSDAGGTGDGAGLDAAMSVALEHAAAAAAAGDVPVGAAVVVGSEVVAAAGNERERRGDPTAHAEVLALRAAAEVVGGWRLEGATLVVTLEPCPMCAGAAMAARVARVAYGAPNPEAGACGSLYNLCADPRLNHEAEVVDGVRAEEASALLTEFFASRRGRAPAGPW